MVFFKGIPFQFIPKHPEGDSLLKKRTSVGGRIAAFWLGHLRYLPT